MLTGTDLVYNSSEIHFEYLRKHEECLIYVANRSGVFFFLFLFFFRGGGGVLMSAIKHELFNAILIWPGLY